MPWGLRVLATMQQDVKDGGDRVGITTRKHERAARRLCPALNCPIQAKTRLEWATHWRLMIGSQNPHPNVAKSATLRMGHPATENRLSKCRGRPLGLCGQRLPELNLISIQVIDPGKATVGFIHSFGVNLYSLLF